MVTPNCRDFLRTAEYAGELKKLSSALLNPMQICQLAIYAAELCLPIYEDETLASNQSGYLINMPRDMLNDAKILINSGCTLEQLLKTVTKIDICEKIIDTGHLPNVAAWWSAKSNVSAAIIISMVLVNDLDDIWSSMVEVVGCSAQAIAYRAAENNPDPTQRHDIFRAEFEKSLEKIISYGNGLLEQAGKNILGSMSFCPCRCITSLRERNRITHGN